MQTPKLHWAVYLWPGLPRLWNRGSWAGLVVAVGFTALTNTLLLATLVFREWMTADVQLAGGGALVVIWLVAWWESRADRRRAAADGSAEDLSASGPAGQKEEERDQLFREAQQRYLEGDWVAAEQALLKLLKHDARDVESRLMLATLWRHQGRGEEALRQLDRLERLEAASKWQYEIATERRAIVSVVRQDEPIAGNEANTNDKKPPTNETNRRLAA